MGVRFDDKDPSFVVVDVETTTLTVGAWRLAATLDPKATSWMTLLDVTPRAGWDVVATVRLKASLYENFCEDLGNEDLAPSMIEASMDADRWFVLDDIKGKVIAAAMPEWQAVGEDDLVVSWPVDAAAEMWERVLCAWGELARIDLRRAPGKVGRNVRIALTMPESLRAAIEEVRRTEPGRGLGSVVVEVLSDRLAHQFEGMFPEMYDCPPAVARLDDDEIPF